MVVQMKKLILRLSCIVMNINLIYSWCHAFVVGVPHLFARCLTVQRAVIVVLAQRPLSGLHEGCIFAAGELKFDDCDVVGCF